MLTSSRLSVARALWWGAPTLVTTILVVVGYLWKASCDLPDAKLGFTRAAERLCVTDIAALWGMRGLSSHEFPYVNAVFTPPQGLTGAVEYPALTGVMIWLVGLGANDVLSFLTLNAVVLGTCAVVISLLLRALAGRRVWLWAAAPALTLYVVYNWDTWTVLATTAAIAALAISQRAPAEWTIGSTVVAGTLLGIGGALKIYPLLLLLPLVCAVFFQVRYAGASLFRRLTRAAAPALAAGGVLLITNLPLMIINFEGWLTPISFQAHRELRGDTMSVWFWSFRLFVKPESEGIQPFVNAVTLGVTAVVVAALLVVGWRLAARRGQYPLLPMSLAVIAAYVVFGKVSSPQYILWLIPLIALVTVTVRWVVALYVVDVVMFTAWFQIFVQSEHSPGAGRALQVVVAACVFTRAALILFIAARGLSTRSPALPSWTGQVGLHHLRDEILEVHGRGPAQPIPRA